MIAERRALIRDHPSLVGKIEDWGLAEWRLGFVAKLAIEAGYYDRERADLDVRAMLRDMLEHPACRFLRSLEVGDLWGEADVRTVLEVLPSLELLEELRIAPSGSVRYGSISAIARCPRLRRLTLLGSIDTDEIREQLEAMNRQLTHLDLSRGS